MLLVFDMCGKVIPIEDHVQTVSDVMYALQASTGCSVEKIQIIKNQKVCNNLSETVSDTDVLQVIFEETQVQTKRRMYGQLFAAFIPHTTKVCHLSFEDFLNVHITDIETNEEFNIITDLAARCTSVEISNDGKFGLCFVTNETFSEVRIIDFDKNCMSRRRLRFPREENVSMYISNEYIFALQEINGVGLYVRLYKNDKDTNDDQRPEIIDLHHSYTIEHITSHHSFRAKRLIGDNMLFVKNLSRIFNILDGTDITRSFQTDEETIAYIVASASGRQIYVFPYTRTLHDGGYVLKHRLRIYCAHTQRCMHVTEPIYLFHSHILQIPSFSAFALNDGRRLAWTPKKTLIVNVYDFVDNVSCDYFIHPSICDVSSCGRHALRHDSCTGTYSTLFLPV